MAMVYDESQDFFDRLRAVFETIKGATEEGISILDDPYGSKVDPKTDEPKLVKLQDDTSHLSRLEWVGHFRTVLANLEEDKKLTNRRAYLVNLRDIIDKAIRDFDALTAVDPE